MDLWGDALDDVVVGKEGVKRYKAKDRWLEIGKLNTDRSLSADVVRCSKL